MVASRGCAARLDSLRGVTAQQSFSPLPPGGAGAPWAVEPSGPAANNSLRYVFVYVFETDAGPYIVDTGWNTDEAFAALTDGLEQIGTSVAAVQGVLITHIHPITTDSPVECATTPARGSACIPRTRRW